MVQNPESKIQERVQFKRFLQYSWDILFLDLGSLVRRSWSATVSEVGWILDQIVRLSRDADYGYKIG